MFNLAAFSEAELDGWLSFMRSTDPNKKVTLPINVHSYLKIKNRKKDG